MKRIANLFLLCLLISANVAAQDARIEFKIMDVTPNGLKISGKVAERYQIYYSDDELVWLKENASMVVKPQADLHFKDEYGNPCIWYKGVTKKISAKDRNNPREPSLFWWLVFNGAISKGGNVDFAEEFTMFEDELIIEIPEVLKENQWYKFESLETGKSFVSEKDEKKPLIRITRQMLDSIGLNGDSVTLKVIYLNHYVKSDVTDSMIIINSKL